MITTDLFESRDICRVCGQTPCNCTHIAEAFIAPALSAANANAEHRRQGAAGGGYRGRIDIPVHSGEDYISAGRALKKAAAAAGEKIEYGLSNGVMSVFSDSMDSDALDQFIDGVLGQGVAEGTSLGYTVIVRGNDFSYSRLKDALSDGHPSHAKIYKNGKLLGTVGSLGQQGLEEMDKSQPSHGRDGHVSHSTYGSRDKGGSQGQDRTARMTTADRMMRDAEKKFLKHMSNADKVKKGWRNPNIKEFAPTPGSGSNDYLQALASAWFNDTFNTGDLHKGIKSQEDVERVLARGIVCPDGKTRKYSIGYNANFDGVEIQSNDHYEYSDYDDAGNEIDSRSGKPWGPYDVIEYHGNQLDEQGVAEGSDSKSAGQAIQKLQSFAKMNPDFTLSDLERLPSHGMSIKQTLSNAIQACDALKQQYLANKQAGNAQFIDNLKSEIKWFMTDRTQSQDPATLGELLQGTLGKVNFQQGVAEVSDATLTSYLTKVDADSRKHKLDPTKRPAKKASKSVMGFARAFNKLDARKEKVDEISLGDYPRKAALSRAQSQMAAATARDPEQRAQHAKKALTRSAGIDRASARLSAQQKTAAAQSRAAADQALKDKYAGIDIDAEIARLQPALQSAYNDYQYGASNTWSQGRAQYDSISAKIKELQRAKQLLSQGLGEVSKQRLGDYLHAAHQDVVDRASSGSFQSGQAGDRYNKADVSPKEKKRQIGMQRAVKRLTREGSSMAEAWASRYPNINADISECQAAGDSDRLKRLVAIKDIIDADLREQSGLGFGE